ncbi:putative aminopeptidase [Flavihumibacter petaseus NBRC 106054]|uniref:Xaa-Pro aminopeptidase n=2 Tax=Flavihumibacter TaxID=1004301 RepID=A0A0E9MV09_9BACT|nr:putative aminopeptidase [Flavihumibacter petaseus NBRC 106054]
MGNEESGMNYRDNTYPFRQDSTFLYYFGLDVAGLAAVIDPESGAEILFGNELTMDQIIWTGPLPSLREMAAAAGITTVEPFDALPGWLKKAGALHTVHYLPPYRELNQMRLAEWFGIPVAQVPDKVSVPLIEAVVRQRAIKEAIEATAIEEAVSISVDMHHAAMKHVKPGMKEHELAAKVLEVAHAAGGRLSYNVICTIEGQVLHNHYYGNTIRNGDLVLLDAGAEQVMHYAGDLTRTFPAGGKFTNQQREVYDVVLNSLERAAGQLHPGKRFIDIHALACEALLQGLKEIGLFMGDPAEGVQEGAHTLFFQCGLGHMMGLDVHDMEDLGEQYVGYSPQLAKRKDFGWKYLRLGRELEAGYVLTVEPGIYIIPELIDRWKAENKLAGMINYPLLEKYRHFTGIRIENNYLITATGSRLFGKPLATTAAEVEAMVQTRY